MVRQNINKCLEYSLIMNSAPPPTVGLLFPPPLNVRALIDDRLYATFENHIKVA